MNRIIRDASLAEDPRRIGILDVRYPDRSEWDLPAYEAMLAAELEKIREEGKA